ncbi:uncharacterized protein LOC142167134 [Nicotiana tabacum]|uniref:Uncharacterized protein LOC142167134 n=1 Tax=Nicotiana tabacum TaxID=4097 RepID=A0AC58SEI2_TOBAC
MMKKFMTDQKAQTTEIMKKVMVDQQALAAAMRNLERQMGQLASAQNTPPVGVLLSDTESNPKTSINVVSLRNERQLEEVQSKKRKQVTFNEKPTTIESESEKSKESEKPADEAVAKQPPPLVARPSPPFPQRLQKVKDNAAYKTFLDILKQVQINIPLVDILQEVPKYAKYIKDIGENKRRLTEFETVALTRECSSRIQSKLPQKLKDSDNEDEMMREIEQVLDMCCSYVHGFGRFEELERPVTLTPPKSSIEEVPKLKLKPLPAHLRYAYLGNSKTLPVIISSSLTNVQEEKLLRVVREHKKAIGWTIADIKGISPSFCMHKIFLEDGNCPNVEQQRRLNPIMKEFMNKEVIKWLDAWWRVWIDYRRLNKVTRKDHFPLPFIDQMLDRLAGHEYYFFFDGYSGYNQIVICPKDQEKTTFTCLYGTFAFKCMPFGLCNAPATFQRCMTVIITDMVEKFVKVFMDDFLDFGSSYDDCLKNLSKVLARCGETNLVLNWKKYHFMVQEGIALGHRVFSSGIEVIRRRLLEKDVTFNFDDVCLKAFEELKKKLVAAPIIAAPDWSLPFELMCDASDHSIGVVLGQRKDKVFYSIYYASKTLDDAQLNYTTAEKELLAVVWAFEKFQAYLVGTKVIVDTDHAAIRKRFLHDVNFYYWDDPFLYKKCADQLMRRCIPEKEVELVLYDCHASPYEGHHGGDRTTAKVLQFGFFWPTLFKDAHAFVKKCDQCQRT